MQTSKFKMYTMSSGKGQVAAWQGFTFRLRQRENLLSDE